MNRCASFQPALRNGTERAALIPGRKADRVSERDAHAMVMRLTSSWQEEGRAHRLQGRDGNRAAALRAGLKTAPKVGPWAKANEVIERLRGRERFGVRELAPVLTRIWQAEPSPCVLGRLLPLTPTLSPRRGRTAARAATRQRASPGEHCQTAFPPLPLGEGRGEGERSWRIASAGRQAAGALVHKTRVRCRACSRFRARPDHPKAPASRRAPNASRLARPNPAMDTPHAGARNLFRAPH
jgi:hypothetical protein